jgi:cobalt/nickel transport protein
MSKVKKLWIGIGILVLLSPLGLLLPAWLKAQGGWGEWGLDQIGRIAGFVPEGMKHLAERWKAPLPDYGLPKQSPGLLTGSLGYLLTAILGVAITAGLTYFLAKILARQKKPKRPMPSSAKER